MPNKQVQMGLSEETIGRIAKIARLRGTDNKTEAVAWAVRVAEILAEADSQGKHLFIGNRYGDLDSKIVIK